MLNDPEIDNKEIVFVLKMKDFPFKTITRKREDLKQWLEIKHR